MFEQAKWIESPCCRQEATPVFYKTFNVSDVADARLYICGLGFYVAKINGKPITQDVLTPALSAYDKTVYYNVYDVTTLLSDGENILEVTLGNGLYNVLEADAWQFEKAVWKGSPKMICELTVNDVIALVSDSSWLTYEGKTTYNSFRCGETFDSSKELLPPVNAVHAKNPYGVLKEQTAPPVRLYETVTPVKNDFNIYDFAKNMTGNVEITAEGNRGDEIVIVYSERVRDDGTLDRENISKHVYNERFATDKFFLSGDGVQTWHGDFSYHGFRYVKLYFPDTTHVKSIVGRNVSTRLKRAGDYKTNNENVNLIHSATINSTLTNFVHVPTDCPHREKNGWTADAMTSSFQTVLNFDIKDAYIHFLDVMTDCQKPSGVVPCIVPTSLWGYDFGSGVTWDSALFVIPYNLYKTSGNADILKRYYEPMKKYIAYLDTQHENDIFTKGLGDWCPPEGIKPVDDKAVLTCFAKGVYDIVAKIAGLFGDETSAEHAKKRSDAVKKAFCDKFLQSPIPSQTFYASLVFFDMVNDKAHYADLLKDEVEKADGHITAGIFGAYIVPVVLRDYGYADCALKAVTKKDYPGWIYMINKCSGSLGENWAGADSRNHHMFSSIDAFIFTTLTGAIFDFDSATNKTLTLRPYLSESINVFEAHTTVYGKKITVSRNKDMFSVTLPEDFSARLELFGKHELHPGKNIFKLTPEGNETEVLA